MIAPSHLGSQQSDLRWRIHRVGIIASLDAEADLVNIEVNWIEYTRERCDAEDEDE